MTTPFEVATSEAADGIAELRIRGACDGTNASKVTAAARGLLTRKFRNIIVNLEGLEFISSAGVGCLIGMMDEAGKVEGRIVFAKIRPEVKGLFDLLGLSRLAECAADLEEARRMITRPPSLPDATA